MHQDMLKERAAYLNRAPAFCVSLETAFTLFAARWGMDWVYVDEAGENADWRLVAQRLLGVRWMEEYGGCYRLIESDHGNS